ILIATIAAAVAGLVSTIGHVMQWGLMLGGLGGRGSNDRRGGGLAALAWIIVAPIMAMLIQLAISRSREFGADASGASLSGHPEPGAGARAPRGGARRAGPYGSPAPPPAPLFIVTPRGGGRGAFMTFFPPPPPIEERIRRLEAMAV